MNITNLNDIVLNSFKSNINRALSKNEPYVGFALNTKLIRLFKNSHEKLYHLTDDETFFETGTLNELAEFYCNLINKEN